MSSDSQATDLDRHRLSAPPGLSPRYEVNTDDPVEAAERVAAFYGKSTEAYIAFAEALTIWLQRFPSKEKQIPFLSRLAELRVLCQRDVMVLSRPNGMLSMIKKIGENADWLRHHEMLPILLPEPSKLYQIVLLRDDLGGSFDRSLAALQTLEPGYTRDDIIALRQDAKPRNAANGTSCSGEGRGAARNASFDDERQDRATIEPSDSGRAVLAASSGGTVIGSDQNLAGYSLVLADMTPADVRLLRTDFADPNELDRLLGRPPLAPEAAIVVLAKVADISVIETRLLPHLGFRRLAHYFSIGETATPDLANYQMALVALRGLSCTIPNAPFSPTDSPATLARQLFPLAQNNATIFGAAEPGWASFGWAEGDA